MNKIGALFVATLCACSSSSSTPAPTAETPTAKAVDPAVAATTTPTPTETAKPEDDLAVLAELAKNGPTQDKFPQADGYVALDRRDIELLPDHSVVEHRKTIVRILDAQRGKEHFADLHIRFDSKRQDLKLVTARTVNPDGEAHAASPDEIGDIVPPELADATSYSDVRERVVSFPSVDMGSVLELEYVRTTKATPDAPQGGEVLLGDWDPIKSMIVSVTVPDGAPAPKLAVAGDAPAPVTSGRTTTYTLADLPDRHRESAQPPDASVLPRLVYGFQADWQQAVSPIADRFLAVAVPPTIPAAVKAQADTLVAGATSDEDKARRLFTFVAHDIRTIDLTLGAAGYEPHAPELVLTNRYADGRDKVALLLAMCAAEGIPGKPVLVRTSHVQVLPSVPTVAQFDRIVAKVSIGGKDIWLDAQDEGSQFGLALAGQDNLVLPLDRKGGELGNRPALDPKTSTSKTTATFTVAPNGDLDGLYKYELSGLYAMDAIDQLRPLQGENLVKFFEQAAARVSAAAIDKDHAIGDTASVGGSFAVTHHVVAPGYAQSQGNYRVLELPASTLGAASADPNASLSTRKYPLMVGSPRTEMEDISVAVPAGWKVSYVPPMLEGASDGMKYTDSCATTGQTVTCHTEITLDKIEIATDKYAGYHDAFAKLHAYERRIVVLEKV